MEPVMRTAILFAVVLLAACADDQHSTAPAGNRSSASRSLSPSDGRTSAQLSSGQSRPTDAVGFTRVSSNVSNWTFGPGKSGVAHTDCPTGTTITGGGYAVDVPDGTPVTALPIVVASIAGGNGWSILVENTQPGATSWTFTVQVLCAS
jgi:hypothetical protein